MVAKMMRWPRPPAARKFRARLVVRRAEGLPPPSPAPAPAAEPASPEREAGGAAQPRAVVAAEVRWKGPRASALGSLRRAAVRRNRTREDAEAAWEEEFESVVTLAAASQREGAAFHPWELAFCVFSVSVSSLDSLLLTASVVHSNAAKYIVYINRWFRCSPVGLFASFLTCLTLSSTKTLCPESACLTFAPPHLWSYGVFQKWESDP